MIKRITNQRITTIVQKYQLNYSRSDFERILRIVLQTKEAREVKQFQSFIKWLFLALQIVIIGGAVAFYFTQIKIILIIVALLSLAIIGFIFLLNNQIKSTTKTVNQQINDYLDAVEAGGDYEISFDEKGMTVYNKLGTHSTKWSDYTRFANNKTYLLFKRQTTEEDIYIPIKSLPANVYEDLVKTAQTYIQN